MARPEYSEERCIWVRSLEPGDWVWLVPLRGNRAARRIRIDRGVKKIDQRPIGPNGFLGNTVDTKATVWIEPMSAQQVADHEHAEQVASVLRMFELAFFNDWTNREFNRGKLTPEDVVALREMASRPAPRRTP